MRDPCGCDGLSRLSDGEWGQGHQRGSEEVEGNEEETTK